ncbi:hypothetical protein V5P93_007220 [Actinokineospora auranticolor]|uniref:Uncharacterized protein n=1 Tax=Actinokineospora auranticolor TaxID=155976 RepID=A0A2S6GRS8_9PSEU|nr:hypothetical protein [Actinokineospora auranticolor]PPK67877.1 hypothetical protein CLV40_106108 [Actinokineospora auranticolor]
MDERKISELFNNAVRDVPPPSFDAGDVSDESARLTRRRNGVLAGSALGFAVLVAGVTVSMTLFSGSTTGVSDNDSAAVAPQVAPDSNTPFAPNEVTPDGPRIAVPESGSPQPTPKQGGSEGGVVGTTADSTPGGCGSADGGLAAALAGELPSAVNRGAVRDSPVKCLAGAKSAAVEVAEGPRRGLLSIMVVPPDTKLAFQPGADRPGDRYAGRAKSGALVVLVSEGVSGSAAPPLDADGLRAIGEKLLPRY